MEENIRHAMDCSFIVKGKIKEVSPLVRVSDKRGRGMWEHYVSVSTTEGEYGIRVFYTDLRFARREYGLLTMLLKSEFVVALPCVIESWAYVDKMGVKKWLCRISMKYFDHLNDVII